MDARICMAIGAALWASGLVAEVSSQLSAQELANAITTLAISVAGAVLLLLPSYQRWRAARRQEKVEDDRVVSESVLGQLAAEKLEATRLRGRIDELGLDIRGLREEVVTWREIARNRPVIVTPAPIVTPATEPPTSDSPSPRGTA